MLGPPLWLVETMDYGLKKPTLCHFKFQIRFQKQSEEHEKQIPQWTHRRHSKRVVIIKVIRKQYRPEVLEAIRHNEWEGNHFLISEAANYRNLAEVRSSLLWKVCHSGELVLKFWRLIDFCRRRLCYNQNLLLMLWRSRPDIEWCSSRREILMLHVCFLFQISKGPLHPKCCYLRRVLWISTSCSVKSTDIQRSPLICLLIFWCHH